MNQPRVSKFLKAWLWIGIIMTFIQVVLGGITRLTGSGLSMTEWSVIMGAIPPLNYEAWMEAFEKYKQFPQYEKVNAGMTLQEFKFIFFWEYLHRNWARLIGVVFIIPFAWMLVKRWLNREWVVKLFLLFLLGALQAVVGWIMVQSGLVDRPWVSQYRLTLHLLLALWLFIYMVQLLLEVPKLSQNIELTSSETSPFNQEVSFNKVSRLFWVFSAFVLLQIIFGGFMAGTHAAKLYHTFPDMNGDMVPSGMFSESPWIANFSENQTTIQFVHRWLGVAVLFVASLLWAKSRKLSRSPLKTGITMMEIAVAVQVVLGIFTLLLSPPAKVSVGLGVLHQGWAFVLCGLMVYVHHLLKKEAVSGA